MSEVRALANAREARLLLGGEFRNAITDFQLCTIQLRLLHKMLLNAPIPFNEMALRILAFLYPSSLARGALATWLQEAENVRAGALAYVGKMKLFVRIRPLMPQEHERNEYVCTTGDAQGIVVHDGRIAKDGRSLYMVHRRFLCRTFDADTQTHAVYDTAVRPLVTRATEAGEGATVLMWGQTGTGKTYTATGLMRCFAEHVYAHYGNNGIVAKAMDLESPGSFSDVVQLRAFEMVGAKRGAQHQLEFFDLLSDRKKVFLRLDENEQAHVRGCVSLPCQDIAAFNAALEVAFEHRTSSSVERNEHSSRSHMFVEVVLPDSSATTIRIGDLAGSERNYESLFHSKARHAEGGDINASLMALKDCIRLRRQQLLEPSAAKQIRVPYRSSKLTLYLKDCFINMPCALVATVSPAPTDVDHTINTLVHMNTMRSGPGSGQNPQQAQGQAGKRCVFKAKSTTVQSRISKTNMEEWNVLNRWDHVKADDDIYQLEGADAEALVWITRQRQDLSCHDVQRWSSEQVQQWLADKGLQDAGIPSSMTGAQLVRLGLRRLQALGGEQGVAVLEALRCELDMARKQKAEAHQDTRKIYGLALGPNRRSTAESAEGCPDCDDEVVDEKSEC